MDFYVTPLVGTLRLRKESGKSGACGPSRWCATAAVVFRSSLTSRRMTLCLRPDEEQHANGQAGPPILLGRCGDHWRLRARRPPLLRGPGFARPIGAPI